MSLQISLPNYIKKPKLSFRKSIEIECFGLRVGWKSGILLDDKYWLQGIGAPGSFFLIPNDNKEISYRLAIFYADCIAFEHEIPTIAFPAKMNLNKNDLPWFYRLSNGSDACRTYLDYLRESFEVSSVLSDGSLMGNVIFKYDYDGFNIVKIYWSNIYQKVSAAIHLYNMALKQPDPLSKYLFYYRVIEYFTKGNGKNWIEEKLTNLEIDYLLPIWRETLLPVDHFKFLPHGLKSYVRKSKYLDRQNADRINILEGIRAKALQHLNKLKKQDKLTHKQIAKRFYNEDRCGIAHGKSNIKKYDLTSDFISILNDLKLVRFLVRKIIEENL